MLDAFHQQYVAVEGRNAIAQLIDTRIEGRVDERVMTTLVAVGATQPIQVADFPADPAEVAAGEARRSVLLRTDDPAGAADVARLLDRQEAPYRPAEVTVAGDGWVQVTWSLAALS